jgi:hypothetical protein
VERADGGEGRRVVRVTCEILRPVPIGVFDVHAEVVRPGKSVDLVEARLSDDDGPLILARGWRIRVAADASPPTDETSRPPSPDGLPSSPFFETGHNVGYHTAMDVRFVRGGFREAGPATVWMRMKVPLVAGEEPTPLVRVLVAADSGTASVLSSTPRGTSSSTPTSPCISFATRWDPGCASTPKPAWPLTASAWLSLPSTTSRATSATGSNPSSLPRARPGRMFVSPRSGKIHPP